MNNSKELCQTILDKLKVIRADLIEQYECDTLDHYDSITDLEEVIDDIEGYLKSCQSLTRS